MLPESQLQGGGETWALFATSALQEGSLAGTTGRYHQESQERGLSGQRDSRDKGPEVCSETKGGQLDGP